MDDPATETPPLPAPPRLRLSAERANAERRRTAGETRGSISTGRWMWEWTKAISTAIVLFMVIRSFLFEAFKIPTGSMEGTLLVGDFLLVNKAVYGAEVPFTHTRLPAFNRPGRGDIIVFLPPHDPHRNYVKRIIGMAGDTVEMRDKIVYLNGKPQVEPYTRHTDPLTDPPAEQMFWQVQYLVHRPAHFGDYHPTRDNWGPLVVPPGKFFALGDNRDNSEDSRYWGFLDESAIKGRPMFVYYSYEKDLSRPFPWLSRVRWGRIGELVH
jgi:signal peptidase I